nr:ribonuclease h [Quercus suber]
MEGPLPDATSFAFDFAIALRVCGFPTHQKQCFGRVALRVWQGYVQYPCVSTFRAGRGEGGGDGPPTTAHPPIPRASSGKVPLHAARSPVLLFILLPSTFTLPSGKWTPASLLLPFHLIRHTLLFSKLHRLLCRVSGLAGRAYSPHSFPAGASTRTATKGEIVVHRGCFLVNHKPTRSTSLNMESFIYSNNGASTTPGLMAKTTGATTSVTPQTGSADPATGEKRKRETKLSEPKFYGVRIGKSPGVYHSWPDCLSQVRGFPKAMFKSFSTLTEAQAFVRDDSISDRGGGVGKTPKWYGVRSGRVPGVYTTWQEVLEQITGWKLPKHKVFKTRIEAERYVADGPHSQTNGSGDDYGDGGTLESIEPADEIHPAKKVKSGKGRKSQTVKDENGHDDQLDYGAYEPGEAPFLPDMLDGFDTSILLDQDTNGLRYKTGNELIATKYQAMNPVRNVPLKIWTDGSTLANGQSGAVAGVGVFFGPLDGRNVSEALSGTRQTNQRAELTAILRALEVAPKDRKVIIISDSNYSIKCCTEWFQKWRTNNWQNSAKKPVENKDLISKIIEILEERQRMNAHRTVYEDDDVQVGEKQYWEHGAASVKFVWVKGHAKDAGNVSADGLATEAARHAKEMLADYASD